MGFSFVFVVGLCRAPVRSVTGLGRGLAACLGGGALRGAMRAFFLRIRFLRGAAFLARREALLEEAREIDHVRFLLLALLRRGLEASFGAKSPGDTAFRPNLLRWAPGANPVILRKTRANEATSLYPRDWAISF